ncbi:ammonium transporter [Oceanibacterium hippocampi]|uniref:Ammonium transporter NrgA n=1 Tax=Oceanibacterium hippocampi TaxID=745714 RepID=A0A1Y5RJ37_9PROT|nr:ammonium transporter [Oceanibacterium hippocampi]SLN16053.1 Ammonium transporter NrgA [Oceanibacterium hippocampi]
MRKSLLGTSALAIALLTAGTAHAEVSEETAYILNSFSFLVNGALVMWMAAGFAMLESGLVRAKNTATICLKNIALYALAGLMFYLVGYTLMYGIEEGGWLGPISLFWAPDDSAAAAGNFTEVGYSASSDWFFQMVFVATAASIVSGTLAERIKLWPFLVFVLVLTGIIYPIQGSWAWGAGWLDAMGFSDYAGSTLVHSVGGWAALVGAVILGARKGKYGANGSVHPMPGSNLPLATIGTFILWLGWFGFNGGSVLSLGSAAAVIEMANVFANTNMAAAGGVVAAMLLTQVLYKKVDLTLALNGAIGGLVSITAGPAAPTMGVAILIGAIGGLLVVLAVPLLDKLKIDDVVGAIPAHLVCGIWGTMAVPISNAETSFVTQFVGVVSVGAFVLVCSTIVWLALKYTMGIRASEEDEVMGLDRAELGLEAYPEFGQGSQSY